MTAQLTRNPQPTIASLSKELALSKQTLERREQLLLQERQLNHQLIRRICELEQTLERTDQPQLVRDSHNSSLPPSLDLPWRKVKRTRSLRQKSGRKVGAQPGHRGETLRQVAHPDQVITHSATACHGCGTSLAEAEVVTTSRRQVFDLPPVKMFITEHRRETRRCPSCRTLTKAEFPTSVRAPVQYGPALLARSAYLNLYQLLPVARTSEALRDLFGRAPSLAIIQRTGRLFSGKLVRCEQRIKVG